MSESNQTNVLERIVEKMKRDALARPGVGMKREMKNGAVLELAFSVNHFRLKIARKGLSPYNDFSNGSAARRKAWDVEVETFRGAFGVLADAEVSQRAYGSFYWVDLVWLVAVGETRDNAHAA